MTSAADTNASDSFRFGDGRSVESIGRVQLPMVVCGLALRVPVSIIPGSLSLLLGRDFNQKYQPELSYLKRTLTVNGRSMKFEGSASGHPAIDLRPEAFVSLEAEQSETPLEVLPRSLRPRKEQGRFKRIQTLLAMAKTRPAVAPVIPRADTRSDYEKSHQIGL